jgi:Uma2 family endonuclease
MIAMTEVRIHPSAEESMRAMLRSPQLPAIVRRLGDALAMEQARRQAFYEAMTEDGKWEFINGDIVMQSPAKAEHNTATLWLAKLLDTFVSRRGLGQVGVEKWLVALTRNDYEPDVCFWNSATAAGFDRRQMKFPAPDFIAEVVSPSTEAIDRGVKFADYAAHGVAEYWIVDPETETVEQYALRDGEYELRIKARTGTLSSVAVAGFTIPVRALFDPAENLAALAAAMRIIPSAA